MHFINISQMASQFFYGFFGSVIWILAQSGPEFNDITPEQLSVFSESFVIAVNIFPQHC